MIPFRVCIPGERDRLRSERREKGDFHLVCQVCHGFTTLGLESGDWDKGTGSCFMLMGVYFRVILIKSCWRGVRD